MKILDCWQDQNENGEDWWVIKYQDDGDVEGHRVIMMPAHTFWTRSAEYDLSNDDLDSLVDIVISETFAPIPVIGEDLYRANALDDAKKALNGRCAKAKLKKRISTRTKDCPTQKIKSWLRENPPDVLEYAHCQNRVWNIRKDLRNA